MMLFRIIGVVALLASVPATAQEVSWAEIDGFLTQVKSCWSLSPDDIASGKTVSVRMALTPAGEIENIEIIDPDKSLAGQRLAAGAIRALERCAPYSFSAESYESWKTLEIDLHP